MPRIPDHNSIPQRPYSGQAAVRGVRPPAIGDAIAAGASQIEQAHLQEMERETNYAVAKAGSTFLAERTRIDTETLKDEDYKTVVDRHGQTLREKASEIAMTIPDAKAKEMFLAQQEPRIAASQAAVQKGAWARERDFKRGDIETDLATLRAMVVNGNGVEAMESAAVLIEAATGTHPGDPYGAEESGEVLRAWQRDSALAWLKALPPEQAIERLDDPVAANLPDDVKAPLRRELEQKTRRGKAQHIVDSWMAQKVSRAQMRQALRKVGDGQLRGEIEREIDYQFQQNQQAQREEQTKWFDHYYVEVRLQKTRDGEDVAMDPRDIVEFYDMDPSQQERLLQAHSAAMSPVKYSDRGVIDQLHRLNSAKRYDLLRDYFEGSGKFEGTGGVGHLLNNSDFDTWSKVTREGEAPIEYETLIVNQQMLRSKAQESGMGGKNPTTAKETGQMLEQLRDWHLRKFTDDGHPPIDSEVEDKIDQLLIEVKTAFTFSSPRIYAMNPNETKEAFETLKEDMSLEVRARVDRGIPVSVLDAADEGDIEAMRTVIEAYERSIAEATR